jgi:hypothetical protein
MKKNKLCAFNIFYSNDDNFLQQQFICTGKKTNVKAGKIGYRFNTVGKLR